MLVAPPVGALQLVCIMLTPVVSIVGNGFIVIVPLADVDATQPVTVFVTVTE